MTSATLSSKYQIVIPKAVRETMGLKSGMQFQMIAYDNIIELILLQPMENLEGMFKGMDTKNIREKKDRKL